VTEDSGVDTLTASMNTDNNIEDGNVHHTNGNDVQIVQPRQQQQEQQLQQDATMTEEDKTSAEATSLLPSSPELMQQLEAAISLQEEQNRQRQKESSAPPFAPPAFPSSTISPSRVSGMGGGVRGIGAVSSVILPPFIDSSSAAQIWTQMLTDVMRDIRIDNQVKDPGAANITQEQWQMLGALVGKDMDRVLEVLDNSDIQWFRSIPSGRRFFRVQGSKNEQYVTTLFHCSCPGFTNQVVRENSHAMCKHQVACMLAEAVKPITCTDLRESDMVNELSSVQLHPSSGHWYGRGSFAAAMGHKTQEDAEFFHHQRT